MTELIQLAGVLGLLAAGVLDEPPSVLVLVLEVLELVDESELLALSAAGIEALEEPFDRLSVA